MATASARRTRTPTHISPTPIERPWKDSAPHAGSVTAYRIEPTRTPTAAKTQVSTMHASLVLPGARPTRRSTARSRSRLLMPRRAAAAPIEIIGTTRSVAAKNASGTYMAVAPSIVVGSSPRPAALAASERDMKAMTPPVTASNTACGKAKAATVRVDVARSRERSRASAAVRTELIAGSPRAWRPSRARLGSSGSRPWRTGGRRLVPTGRCDRRARESCGGVGSRPPDRG